MKVNVKPNVKTFQGGQAVTVNPYERLKRTVMACMLFEDNFYEDGMKCADRIIELAQQCTLAQVCDVARSAAQKYRLRHVPLQLIVEVLKKKEPNSSISELIYDICQRPDQMTDLLALYWRDGRRPLANQLKKGLAKAFTRFDEYQLSKYNRDNPIKLRDILFLTHAKPLDDAQAELWKRLVDNKLKIADTWETRLSSGADKKESFLELIQAHKMGKLAILRNLRNMKAAGIDKKIIGDELFRNIKEMLPFQYIAAAKEVPEWEDIIEGPMIMSSSLKPKLPGDTIVVVDVSGSMSNNLSAKSTMRLIDAACGLAILIRECCPNVAVFSFSNQFIAIPPRHGFALRDAIIASQPSGGTYLAPLLNHINMKNPVYDRLIIITDEQVADDIPVMKRGKNYILNISTCQNGFGSKNQWTTISGFSEASVDFIRELELGND